jgi:hypothetical protein
VAARDGAKFEPGVGGDTRNVLIARDFPDPHDSHFDRRLHVASRTALD